MKDDLENRIISLVAEERIDPPGNITANTRLMEDLGMDGDDAVGFFEKYRAIFEVDLTGIRWGRHFGREGFNPFVIFLPSFWQRRRSHCPVTIRDLVVSARTGKWEYNYER
jgi:hypothetical protein